MPEFHQAEAVMWEHPDSALTLLKTMEKPSSSDELNYATWCLLMTQARDKNYIKHSSDSLIAMSVNYFERHSDELRKAMTYFYAGQVYKDLNQPETAINYYLKAKEMCETTDNHRLTSLICSNLGMLYAYRRTLKDDAKRELRDAYNYAVMSRDSSRISSSLCSLGRIYGVFGQWDSVIYFYTGAMKIAEQVNDLRSLSNAQSEIAHAYIQSGIPEQAIGPLSKSIDIKTKEGRSGLTQSYLSLGKVYKSLNKVDSSIVYLNKALITDNLYTIRDAYWYLYHLHKEQRQYQEAIGYNELYREYADSIMQLAHSKEIKEIQEKYAHEKLVNENNLLKIRNGNLMRTYLGILIMGLMITACLVFVYQRKLLNKERLLQKIKDELNINLAKLRENEAAMKENEEMIKKMSMPVNRNTGPENHSDGIENLRQKNYALLYQNEILGKKVQAYTDILQEKELKLDSYGKLQKQNEALARREQFLMGQLEKHIEILGELRHADKVIRLDEWPAIIKIINRLNNNFTLRLKQQMPFLSESDVQCCCLIKLHLTTTMIANLTAVSPASVTKRKQRIRNRISRQTNHPLEKTKSLDDFMLKF
ncbi:tetratricopeptide repeat protein [Gaoshiqia sp. Z1-71]|uniref:tetratricopeptide repeat protein n=1 Tax=Gaoshiqia hydrogeniformans TaxID=3290090 RepID=UPI003BF7DC3D